jgi:hypothetical protein
MIIATAAQAARDKFRVDSHGAGAWIHPYFGTGAKALGQNPPQAGAPLPMLYLVEQDANTTIPTHFHQVTQFQVAVAGSGRLGAQALSPVTLHYASAFTGYGPLAASSEGLSYFTARNAFDPGLRPLPEARAELDAARALAPGNRPVNRLTEPVDTGLPVKRSTHQTLLADAAGAGAAMLGAAPGDALNAIRQDQDRILILIHGEAQLDGQRLQAMDGLFLGAGELALLQVGDQGLLLMELTFAPSK